MAFVVVYDACVLYPGHLRDVLIRVALSGAVQAKWTDLILDEAFNSLKKNRPDLEAARLDRTRTLMDRAIRDAKVTGFEPLIDGLDLPDENDRHVLAAAIRSHAQVIVTDNLADFPAAALQPYDIEPQSADVFLGHVYDLQPEAFIDVLESVVAPFDDPPMTLEELLDLLVVNIPQTVAQVREHLASTD